MKKTILLTAVLLFVSAATAVFGGPEPREGEMAITSGGSSASSTTSVGPNSTEWSSSVEMRGRSPNITEGGRVENVSHTENGTTFSGHIQAPTPCHVIDQETERLEENNYRMNIQTVKENLENGSQACTQQVVMISYDGNFEAESPYSLEIQQNNETVDTLESSLGAEPVEQKNGGLFSALFKWLGNLF